MKKIQNMKSLLLTLFIAGSFATAYGQLTAGGVVPGTSIGDPSLNIYIDTNISLPEDTVYLDLDCDGIDDFGIVMRKGYMDTDYPNWIISYPVNTDFEVCIDSNTVVHYFSAGELLDCTGSLSMTSVYADMGRFYQTLNIPAIIMNQYIAYRKISTNEAGWIKISFDLDEWDSTYPITMDIDEVLYLCLDASLSENQTHNITIFPNPSLEGSIKIEGDNSIASLHVYSLTGQSISVWKDVDELDLPQEKGVYIVHWTDVLGNSGYERVLRN